jgi:ParB family chromosome partitioning protein
MGKLDQIRQFRGNITESMGAGTIHGEAMPAVAAPTPPTAPARMQGLIKVKNVAEIPVARIDRDPQQPREDFDEGALTHLAESMKAKGQLQPIRVRWDEGRGVYVILYGERRWRAAKLAGMPTMTAIIVEGEIPPAELLALQVVENALREDLKPIEQARAYKQLMGLNGWSTTQVGKELAIDQSSVSRALKLLELPEQVQELVEQGALPPRTAYEVSKLDRAEDQVEVATQAASERLTRAQVIEAITAKKAGRSTSAPRRAKYEYRAGGSTLSITGEAAAAGPDAILALLEEAMTDVRATEKLLDSTEAA